jgi:hypothetical protein
MELSKDEISFVQPDKPSINSIEFGKFKDSYTIIKDSNKIDISHIKRIRKN